MPEINLNENDTKEIDEVLDFFNELTKHGVNAFGTFIKGIKVGAILTEEKYKNKSNYKNDESIPSK